jgi:hypothetical protein
MAEQKTSEYKGRLPLVPIFIFRVHRCSMIVFLRLVRPFVIYFGKFLNFLKNLSKEHNSTAEIR